MTGQRYGFLFHWTAQHYWRAQRTGGAPQPSASKSRGGSKVISKVVLQSSPRFSPGGDGLAVHILAPRLSPLPARGWEELGVSPLCLTEGHVFSPDQWENSKHCPPSQSSDAAFPAAPGHHIPTGAGSCSAAGMEGPCVSQGRCQHPGCRTGATAGTNPAQQSQAPAALWCPPAQVRSHGDRAEGVCPLSVRDPLCQGDGG